MAIVRLNQSHRAWLSRLAYTTVSCPEEAATVDTTYKIAAPLVRAIVEIKYPPKDMKVFAKYEAARRDQCIKLNLTAGGVVQFNFHTTEEAPLVPDTYTCSRRIYQADEATTAAVQAHAAACDARKKADATKMADYLALIRCSVKLEEIEAVWPAASSLRATLNRSVPVVLSDDVVNRIRADVASSSARAENNE